MTFDEVKRANALREQLIEIDSNLAKLEETRDVHTTIHCEVSQTYGQYKNKIEQTVSVTFLIAALKNDRGNIITGLSNLGIQAPASAKR